MRPLTVAVRIQRNSRGQERRRDREQERPAATATGTAPATATGDAPMTIAARRPRDNRGQQRWRDRVGPGQEQRQYQGQQLTFQPCVLKKCVVPREHPSLLR